jgi:hypothetical protein
MKYQVHITTPVQYFKFVVEYDPYTEEIDPVLTVNEAMAWAKANQDALGIEESHIAREAVAQGARPYTPNRNEPYGNAGTVGGRGVEGNYDDIPQGYVDHTLPVCPNNNSHQVKRADKPANTRRGPSFPIKCTICKDPNNAKWPLTVGWEDQ